MTGEVESPKADEAPREARAAVASEARAFCSACCAVVWRWREEVSPPAKADEDV